MSRTIDVAWRWLRRRLYRVSRWPEQALGDNHPWFPRTRLAMRPRLAKATDH